MAETHEPLCDGNHTDRQACNRSLEHAPAASEMVAREEAMVDEPSPERTMVLEAPQVLAEAATFDPIAPAPGQPAGESDVGTTPAALPAERVQMSAPSPWAVRAWEDTALAVGATASPAPSPGTSTGETDANDEGSQGIAGHMPLLLGLAGAAALAIFIARRRRS